MAGSSSLSFSVPVLAFSLQFASVCPFASRRDRARPVGRESFAVTVTAGCVPRRRTGIRGMTLTIGLVFVALLLFEVDIFEVDVTLGARS